MAATLYGLITVGGQFFANLGFSLYEIACLIFFYAVPLTPLVVVKKNYRISPQDIPFFITFGFIGAGLQIGQFTGIVLGVPVAIVALLLYSQPIWTTALGRIFLREELTLKKVSAIILAVLGIVILMDPFGPQQKFSSVGLGAAVCAGIFFSFWVIWGRKSALRDKHFVTTTFGYALFSSLWLFLAYPLVHTFVRDPILTNLRVRQYFEFGWAVAGYALFAGLLPNLLAFAGLKKVQASMAGVLLLFEPVSAAILAFFFFAQPLTPNILIGGALILFANYVVLRF
ncbi:MAG: DMT family transporter [bacterium]